MQRRCCRAWLGPHDARRPCFGGWFERWTDRPANLATCWARRCMQCAQTCGCVCPSNLLLSARGVWHRLPALCHLCWSSLPRRARAAGLREHQPRGQDNSGVAGQHSMRRHGSCGTVSHVLRCDSKLPRLCLHVQHERVVLQELWAPTAATTNDTHGITAILCSGSPHL